MFGDLRRFDTDWAPGTDWFRRFFDEMWPDPGAADIRSVPRGSFPMINVGRTDDAVRVYVFAPGLTPEALDISLQDNVLTVGGQRSETAAEDEASAQRSHFRRERQQGAFSRSLALPEGLDVERAEARFHNGVCEVVLPKREELKPRRIEIKAS
ncbi:Hsp20/alpha crystallin family protein [Halomonas nitroreducens]|uniref:Hsp20/alpha crystallin family protein n=1 Tax=Halomonas nitroreducens TaxID=447425 RepID=A0A431UYV0_9GAMM|nr:Hsp20/alpha crystallin family protein [Halomonas nitroreducens]RTQ99119.1 Hsp20/alpha crystallin family protein [Halomonas nitroreducens]